MTWAGGPWAGGPWADSPSAGGGPATHTASGALAAQAASIAGSAAHHALHSASGALASQASSVSGSSAHTAPGSFSATGALASQAASIAGAAILRAKHSASGALAAGAASISGAAVHSGEGAVEERARTGAGRPSKPRRRHVVEIDGEQVAVSSAEEAVALLESVRERVQKQAEVVIERASKAKRRPVRKVLADARKALDVPSVSAPPEIQPAIAKILSDIDSLYRDTMATVEIAARLAAVQAAEEDDEDVLLLIA